MKKHRKGFDPLGDPKDGHLLTRAIIDTIHEPLIVLDEHLRIIVASKSFYKKFDLTPEKTNGKMFCDIKNGMWDIDTLCALLEQVIPKHKNIEKYEIEYDFPFFGLRTMIINAREVESIIGEKKMLISIFDITEQRAMESEKEKLMNQKDLLLKEMRHRIANSLQLIASILILKADLVESKESRSHLEDAHERIMAIATVQKQLDPVPSGENIQVAEYLTNLCKSLARSMIGGRKPITIKVTSTEAGVSSDMAVSFGLITTELVINSLKHAFPHGKSGKVIVTYTATKARWVLSIEDNGVGESSEKKNNPRGLGTSIIGALANQLQAVIRTDSSRHGTKVSLVHSNV